MTVKQVWNASILLLKRTQKKKKTILYPYDIDIGTRSSMQKKRISFSFSTAHFTFRRQLTNA